MDYQELPQNTERTEKKSQGTTSRQASPDSSQERETAAKDELNDRIMCQITGREHALDSDKDR